jgi:hypothetical protein
MSSLQWFAIALSSFSAALFLGFMTAAIPDFFAIHLIVSAAIVGIFAVNGLSQSSTYISYGRANPILINFVMRAIAVLALYWVVIGVGHWTFMPEVAIDESLL